MDTQHLRAEWLTDTTAAKRLALTVDQLHGLIRDGTLQGELARASHPAATHKNGKTYERREFIWWVRAEEVEFEMSRRAGLAVDATESAEVEWDTHGYRLDKPEPCVLYGLLTANDVKELERRRAMLAGRLTVVIPIEDVRRELAAVG